MNDANIFFVCSLEESADAHETAADVICALLEMLNPEDDPGDDMLCLEMNVLAAVLNLEPCYLAARELEDLDRSHNFCRVFTELAETFLSKIVVSSSPGSHFAMPVFNAVVACCSQNDYDIADVTFNLWYRLAEEVYEKSSESLIETFRYPICLDTILSCTLKTLFLSNKNAPSLFTKCLEFMPYSLKRQSVQASNKSANCLYQISSIASVHRGQKVLGFQTIR